MAANNKIDFLKAKQAYLNDIKKSHHQSPKYKVIAATTTLYVMDNYKASSPYLTGKVIFEEGFEREVCFFLFKESEADLAKKIFGETSKMADDPGILKPLFVTFNEQKKIWLVCYEKFDSLLSGNPPNIDLTENMGDSIRKLLETIKYIHQQRRVSHGALSERGSYVVVSGRIKIIFGSSFSTWDEKTDPEEVENTKMKNLKDFRDMLKDVMSQLNVDWKDKDLFFEFFDQSTKSWFGNNGFVDQLIDHPSLKKPEERNLYLFKIEQSIRSNSLRKASVFMDKLKSKEFTSKYSNWNDDDKLSQAPELERIYNEVEVVDYDGNNVRHLIRFLSNAYVHYRLRNKEENFDHDVRTVYPDFLNRMHIYL